MELKTKYQYSYFIYPYVIDKLKYEKYLLKMLKDKHCKLKIFEKEKDLDLYMYFLPNVRDYIFPTFRYNKAQIKQLEKLDNQMKSKILSQNTCNIFEYTFEEELQGKIGQDSGIFFDVRKIEVICFNTGICFLLLKTNIDEDKFSNLLDFNYKFRDINSDYMSLKQYENIRLQTNSFKDIKDLSNIIDNITGPNINKNIMNIDTERFLVYSYACIEQDVWNDEVKFENIQGEFSKFINILPSMSQSNYDNIKEEEIFKRIKFARIGISKQGTMLLTSAANTQNYTKLSNAYEQEYLYTYIFTLYKKLYMNKINLEFKNNCKKNIKRKELIDFTKDIWIQEITNDNIGDSLSEKWELELELDKLYKNIKNKYDIEYKNMHIEKSNKVYYLVIALLVAIFTLNILGFILIYLRG